jgi:hypothetical protein
VSRWLDWKHWLLCASSRTYREFATWDKAEVTLQQTAQLHDITRAQAFALIWANAWPPMRIWLAKYRDPRKAAV